MKVFLIGFLLITSTSAFASKKLSEYDVSIDPAGANMSLEEKLMTVTADELLPTAYDNIVRLRSITAAMASMTDREWLLVRNFLGFNKLLTAKETKDYVRNAWRETEMRGSLELMKYEAAIGRALIAKDVTFP